MVDLVDYGMDLRFVEVDLTNTEYVVLSYYQQQHSQHSNLRFLETQLQLYPVGDYADANLHKSIPVRILLCP
jgi:hypothetical protein